MIKIVTHKSINIQVCDILMEKENLFERRRIIFDFDLQNSTQFTKMVIDNKIVGLLIGDKLIKSFEKELETSTNGTANGSLLLEHAPKSSGTNKRIVNEDFFISILLKNFL